MPRDSSGSDSAVKKATVVREDMNSSRIGTFTPVASTRASVHRHCTAR